MLDRADAGGEGVLHDLGRVGVRGHIRAPTGGFLDDGAQLFGEYCGMRIGSVSENTPPEAITLTA